MIDSKLYFFWYKAIIASIVVIIITALNSSGYHYFDEHYQIIEFARLKLGYNAIEDLPWEFNRGVRSTLQPIICMVILKFCSLIGIHDPYYQSASLRIISGLVSILVISFFLKKTFPLVEERFRLIYILLSYFLWFIPYNSVRFSSETWSALSFMVALGFCINDRRGTKKYALIGIFIGISFLFRFQSAIMSAGLMAWLIIIEKEKFRDLIKIKIYALFIVLLGIAIDFWFYGSLTFSFFNYYVANLVEGKVNNFGTAPWYDQLRLMFVGPIYPIGLFILISLAILLIKMPKNILLWIAIPFIACHMFIPHKELRFMFPLIFLIPLGCVLALKLWYDLYFLKSTISKYVILVFFAFLITINCIALLVISIQPADAGQKDIVHFISTTYMPRNVILLYTNKDDPYNPILPLKERFYENESVNCYEIKYLDSLLNLGNEQVFLLCTREDPYTILSKTKTIVEPIPKKDGIPQWIQLLTSLYHLTPDKSSVNLYELKSIN